MEVAKCIVGFSKGKTYHYFRKVKQLTNKGLYTVQIGEEDFCFYNKKEIIYWHEFIDAINELCLSKRREKIINQVLGDVDSI